MLIAYVRLCEWTPGISFLFILANGNFNNGAVIRPNIFQYIFSLNLEVIDDEKRRTKNNCKKTFTCFLLY
jgi:hypothetical protein